MTDCLGRHEVEAMMRRRMRLVAFLLSGPTAHHHGMWRHPETDNSFLTPEYYEHIARVLEAVSLTLCFSPTFWR